jgi:membrane protease YdiL (CAAX protease family)
MLRTWTYRWWRPVLGLVLLGVGFILVLPLLTLPILIVGVLIQGGKEDFLDQFLQAGTLEKLTPAGLLYLNVTLASLILLTWGLVRFLHNLRPRWLASVMPKLRWKFLFACLGLALVALIAQIAVSVVVPAGDSTEPLKANPVNGTTIAMLLIVLLTTPLQSAGEEYAFRGYMLQALGSLFRRRWVTLLVTATLFAVAHGLQNPPLFFDRFAFGFIAAWLVIRTGGLEAGIALHVLNNYLAFGTAILFGDVSATLNVTEVSWWNIPVTVVQSLVYVALVLWLARKMGLRNTTQPPLPAPPAAPPGSALPPVPEPA